MGIGDLIYNRRKELGLTMEEVGNAVGVNKSTVKKWESGDISNMRRDKIALLAKVLQISPIKLIIDENVILPTSTENVFMRPLYDSVAAGFNVLAQNTVVGYIPTQIHSPSEQEKYIWVNVVGDSMSPMIDDGSKVLVKLQEPVDSGQIAIVLIDDEEAVVKRVVYGDDWIELHSVNPYYPPRRFKGADVQRVRVMGLVKEVSKTI